MRQSSDVLCILTTYKREFLLPSIIRQINSQTLPVDIVIWNNNPEVKLNFNEIDTFGGVNSTGMIQRFLPALIYPHKYVMFVDDDIFLGKKFLETAISIIEKTPEAVVTSGGSVIESPVSRHSVHHRKYMEGHKIRNAEPWHLDIGCLYCSVCLRKHIQATFRSGIIPAFNCEDILFFISHAVYNEGKVILSPHDEDDRCGVIEFREEHKNGINSGPTFTPNRENAILEFSTKLNWKPTARNFEEWDVNGCAFKRAFK